MSEGTVAKLSHIEVDIVESDYTGSSLGTVFPICGLWVMTHVGCFRITW